MTIDEIRQRITDDPDNAHLLQKGYKPVFSASETSKIVIVGQAPGRKAQESGIPWNDISGDKLREWLGVSRQQFYSDKIALIPMDFYFPGKGSHGDLPPRKDFAACWHPQLLEHMPGVELIILVGQYAQKYYLGDDRKRNLTETVQASSEYLPTFLPLVHPSPLTQRWRTKNPWFEAETIPLLQKKVEKILDSNTDRTS